MDNINLTDEDVKLQTVMVHDIRGTGEFTVPDNWANVVARRPVEKINIKYHADIDHLAHINGSYNSAWIDLRSAEDLFLEEGQFKLISLGISMQLPDGFEAIVAPRSSTFKNFGIIMTNSIGVIDNSYCGNNDIWRFPAYCLEGKHFENGRKGTRIKFNDRICQFRIQLMQPDIVFNIVDELTSPDRGGFGSTGV